jgi:hypothetical protein
MKKTYILILALIVLLLPIMSLYSCESFESITKSTVVGEVMYVKASTYSLQEDSDISFFNSPTESKWFPSAAAASIAKHIKKE